MNPRIPASYAETARWLENFATSHAKREHPAIEAIVDTGGAREGRSYGLRLLLHGRMAPPAEAPPVELSYPEVAEGRTRFAWCQALAERIRAEAQRLVSEQREAVAR
jgi:hypothetical protein